MVLVEGCFADCLPSIFDTFEGDAIVLIHSRRKGGFCQYAESLMNSDARRFVRLCVPDGDPSVEGLADCYKELCRLLEGFKKPLFVVSGGGRVIDYAKLLAGVSGGWRSRDFVKEAALYSDIPPVVAIPTTAGSGSEATSFAVVYRGDEKLSVDHPSLKPSVAVLDPYLLIGQPPEGRAISGMDALSQAVEAIWAVHSTAKARDYGRKALNLIIGSFVKSVQDPQDIASCIAMLKGSYWAGEAINITRTTGAHAFSYHLTRQYGVPHGEAVGMLLVYFIRLNWENLDSECKQIYCEIFSVDGLNALVQKIESMRMAVGLTRSLFDLGALEGAHLDKFIESVNTQRLKNNPKQWTTLDEIRADFESLAAE